MRRFDKKKNIQKANIIAEQRHLESNSLIKEDINELGGTPEGNFNGSISFDIKEGDNTQTLVLKNLVYYKSYPQESFSGVDGNGETHRFYIHVNSSGGEIYYKGITLTLMSTINDTRNLIKFLNDNNYKYLTHLAPEQLTSGY